MDAVRWPSARRTNMVAVVALSPEPAVAPPSALRAVLRSQPASPLGFEPSRPMSDEQLRWWRQWRDAVALVLPLGERRELADAVQATADTRFRELAELLRGTDSPRTHLAMSATIAFVAVLSEVDDAIDDGSITGWQLTAAGSVVATVSNDEILTKAGESRLVCSQESGITFSTPDSSLIISGWRRSPAETLLLSSERNVVLPRNMSSLLEDAAPGAQAVDVCDAGDSLWAEPRSARRRVALMAARYGGNLTIEPE